MNNIIVIDTETTGLQKGARPVEIAYVDVGGEKEYCERFNPGMAIDAQAAAITGIGYDQIKDCRMYTDFEMPDCQYIAGHNISYDVRILAEFNPAIDGIKQICTLALSRHCWPHIPSHKLADMIELVQPGFSFDAHSALDDVKATRVLLLAIVDKLGLNTADELFVASEKARVIKTMPFGKHRGVPMSSLPKSYVRWALENLEMDKHLRAAFEAVK